jgi:hypothetical protein
MVHRILTGFKSGLGAGWEGKKKGIGPKMPDMGVLVLLYIEDPLGLWLAQGKYGMLPDALQLISGGRFCAKRIVNPATIAKYLISQ